MPIEERSLEAYESGWQKAIELGIFNSWTAKMREALGRLNSELYPPLSEVGFRLRSEGGAQLPESDPQHPSHRCGGRARTFSWGFPLPEAPASPPASRNPAADASRLAAGADERARAASGVRGRALRRRLALVLAGLARLRWQQRRSCPRRRVAPEARKEAVSKMMRAVETASRPAGRTTRRSSCSAQAVARTRASGRPVTTWACFWRAAGELAAAGRAGARARARAQRRGRGVLRSGRCCGAART